MYKPDGVSIIYTFFLPISLIIAQNFSICWSSELILLVQIDIIVLIPYHAILWRQISNGSWLSRVWTSSNLCSILYCILKTLFFVNLSILLLQWCYSCITADSLSIHQLASEIICKNLFELSRYIYLTFFTVKLSLQNLYIKEFSWSFLLIMVGFKEIRLSCFNFDNFCKYCWIFMELLPRHKQFFRIKRL